MCGDGAASAGRRAAGSGSGRPESGRGSSGSGRARGPWRGAAGWPDRQAGHSEREARRRALRGAWRQPPPSTAIPP